MIRSRPTSKDAQRILDDINRGECNPFTEGSEEALGELVAFGLVSGEAVQAACDGFVAAKAVQILGEVASGALPYADPSVHRVLRRAVALRIIDACVLEYMDIVYVIANSGQRRTG